MLLRISHAIGDGIALVNVLKKISTALDGGEMRLLDFQRRDRTSRSFLALLWACVTFIFVCAYGFFKAVLTAAGPYDTKTVFKGSRPPYTSKRVVVSVARRLHGGRQSDKERERVHGERYRRRRARGRDSKVSQTGRRSECDEEASRARRASPWRAIRTAS